MAASRIALLAVILVLAGCAEAVPGGPASLQVVPANYYSSTLRTRSYVVPRSKRGARGGDGAVVVIERYPESAKLSPLSAAELEEAIKDVQERVRGEEKKAQDRSGRGN